MEESFAAKFLATATFTYVSLQGLDIVPCFSLEVQSPHPAIDPDTSIIDIRYKNILQVCVT